MAYNTWAEIQRTCNFVASNKTGTLMAFRKRVSNAIKMHGEMELVLDTGEKFNIHTNGVFYLITDNHIQSLYKLIREPIK